MRTIPLLAAGLLSFALGVAQADPFCCECKDNKKHLLDESNVAVATTKCSLKCRKPTVATKGSCEAPASATPAPSSAQPTQSQQSTGAVALFKSEDCSGDAVRLKQSEAQLAEGFLSYQVDGGRVSAHAKANFAGAATQPVVGSLCVAPGWPIGSVKVGN